MVDEFNFQKAPDSPYVLAVYEAAMVDGKPCVSMELAPDGSVRDLLTVKERLFEDELRILAKQILLGIKAIHDADVAHRDIKPGNCLMSNGIVKITDFGLAVYTDGRSTPKEMDRRRGTPGFKAPELEDDTPIRNIKALDIYAAGVSFWQLMVGMVHALDFEREEIGLNGDIKDLIYRMTDPDAYDRLTVDEALAHPWFDKPVPERYGMEHERPEHDWETYGAYSEHRWYQRLAEYLAYGVIISIVLYCARFLALHYPEHSHVPLSNWSAKETSLYASSRLGGGDTQVRYRQPYSC